MYSEEMGGNIFSNLRALFQQPSPVLFCSLWKAGPHMGGRTSKKDRNWDHMVLGILLGVPTQLGTLQCSVFS